MTTLRQALYGIALLGALALLLWGTYQQSQAEQGRTALAQEELENLTARSNRQAATIVRLGGEVHAQRLAQQSLHTQLAELRKNNPQLEKEWDEKLGDRMIKIVFIGQHIKDQKDAIIAELDKTLAL